MSISSGLLPAEAAEFVDDEDGAPIGRYLPGAVLPSGDQAWQRLGVGHRCETWLAWSPRLWCQVVVKFPRPHQVEHPRARGSLRREVAALGGLAHPALPRIYVDGTGEALPYLVFEQVDGLAIDVEVEERGAFSPVEVALLGTQTLAALRLVHARGIAHVDVKPDNIVVRAGRAVLLDFGSAREIGAPQPEGLLIGSPGYAAPDLEAGRPIATAMDVYGVGVTLHESLTGAMLFDPDLAAQDRPLPEPVDDSALAALLQRMLDPEPAARPGVDAALAELGAISAAAGAEAWPAWATPAVGAS